MRFDFVVSKCRSLQAIEVKSGKRRMALPGLEKFRQSYKNSKALIVGAQGIEIEEFLVTPLEHWL